MAFPLSYSEHRPPSDLAPWVACFWQITGLTAHGMSHRHRVLPDGCADVLFDLEATRRGSGMPAEVVGPMSSALMFGLCGTVDLLGVRLRPGAISAFGGIPAGRLLDTTAPITELRPALRINVAELADAVNSAARIRLLADACRSRFAALNQPDPLVRQALTRWGIAERTEFRSVSGLARDLGLSDRAFERRFVSHVGLTPVRYRRLARFRSVLRLYAGGLQDWATLATTTGSATSHISYGTVARLPA
jgi:methylphosphotriester-DNA--protein-cysteine methyltransferase